MYLPEKEERRGEVGMVAPRGDFLDHENRRVHMCKAAVGEPIYPRNGPRPRGSARSNYRLPSFRDNFSLSLSSFLRVYSLVACLASSSRDRAGLPIDTCRSLFEVSND